MPEKQFFINRFQFGLYHMETINHINWFPELLFPFIMSPFMEVTLYLIFGSKNKIVVICV